MECSVAHPFGQLQLELPGVPPLTADTVIEQQLTTWTNPHTKSEWHAILTVVDAESRTRRARRINWIEQLWSRLPEDGFGVVGGAEVVWLYYESTDCFAAELDIAAVLAAHAACERGLASYLELRGSLTKQLYRAGLGPIAQAALDAGVIDARLHEELSVVTNVRKATAHFRPPFDPHSIHGRWLATPTSVRVDPEDVAMADAERALTAVTDLLVQLHNMPWGPSLAALDARPARTDT